jgi:transposase-like protein
MKRGPKRDRCPLSDDELFMSVKEKGALQLSREMGVNKSTVNRWLKRRKSKTKS